MSEGKIERFAVVDSRKRRFGIVHLDDFDSDRFRSLSPSHRLIYVSLCMFVGRQTGTCYPKISRLARMTGFSRSTIFRALNKLESLEFVERQKLHLSKARRINLYTLL